MKTSVNLEEGLEIARSLEAVVSPVGGHIAMCGSVLQKGRSSKDLDLIVFPDSDENGDIVDKEKIKKAIDSSENFKIMRDYIEDDMIDKSFLILLETKLRKRIDLFFMSVGGYR